MRRFLTLGLGVLWTIAIPVFAVAQVTSDRVLVVVNDTSAISQAIGSYYAGLRAIPADQIFHYPAGTTTAEEISRDTYNSAIRDPLKTFLEVTRPDLKDQIVFIVLTKDVPIKVANSGGSGTNQSAASVDSELTQLFTGKVPDGGHQGRLLNPLFNTYHPPEKISRSNVSYCVFRLDGYQTNVDPGSGVPIDIKRIIDDAQNPATAGQILLDATSASGQGNNWMIQASTILTEMNIPHVLDTTGTYQKNHSDLIGYCSWGSNDGANPGPPYFGEIPPASGNFYPGHFLPGSFCSTYVSTSARTFIDGNQNYGQSLVADLVRVGASGENGHVYEPYLDAVARPQILFPHIHQGLQVGTAYYHSIEWLSWENIIVCDPLMVSPIVSLLPPEVSSWNPTRIPLETAYPDFLIQGDHFTSYFDMRIRIGGIRCTNLDIQSPTLLLCDAPALPSGVHDLYVKSFMGEVTVEKAVIAYPAMDLTGTPGLGQPVTITLHGTALDSYLTFMSNGTASIPFPPFGTLCLDPSMGFFIVFGGLMLTDQLDLTGTIPDDPAFSGVTVHFQSLIGSNLATNGKLTNCVTLAIP